MTIYRLLNNVHGYHEAFVDFRAMRKQFDGVKVWFSQKNQALSDKLTSGWQPVAVSFGSDLKSNQKPDISVWNYSCLVLSAKAKAALEPLLKEVGEFLPLADGFWLFNCLDSVGGEVVNHEKSRFQVEAAESVHIPRELFLKEDKIVSKVLFKPGFSHNSFLLCTDTFKTAVDKNGLAGVVFEKDLAKMFL